MFGSNGRRSSPMDISYRNFRNFFGEWKTRQTSQTGFPKGKGLFHFSTSRSPSGKSRASGKLLSQSRVPLNGNILQ